MSTPAYTRTEVELLLFELGGALFGADASQILRIERPPAGGPEEQPGPLGEAVVSSRALVFQTPEGLGSLKVDMVRGVRQVAIDSLRRLPPAAAAQPYAIGVWLDGDKPVLLIDLVEMHKKQGRQ
ncbi:MAG: Frizzy aggregation protein FrzB [Myxococcaceae bacterium]